MAYRPKQRTFRKRETKEEFAARKKAEKDAAYETIDHSLTEIMQDSDKFKDYLRFQSHMERYTVSNTILIMAQRPDATQLKSADSWNELGASVNKGEKGMQILEPHDFIDDEGHQRTAYHVKYVFDVSQTNAEPKPAKSFDKSPQALVRAMLNATALNKAAVDELPIENSVAFYDADNKTLLVKKHSDSVSLFKDISRELSLSEIAGNSDEYNRTECLPSAVCASYMLCEKYGIDNSDIHVDSAKAMWNGKENKDVRTMLTMANDSVYSIGKDIYVQMQKNKEKAEKEPAR